MRIRITTVGSTGDIQPYLALAKGLLQAGHDVALIASRQFAARMAEVGVPFRDSGQQWDAQQLTDAIRATSAERNSFRQLRVLFERMGESLLASGPRVLEATADADLILVHNPDLVGLAAPEQHRLPWISGHLVPFSIPSRHWNPAGSDLGALLNAAITRLGRWGLRLSADASMNAILVRAGGSPRRDLLFEGSHSPLLNLVGVSPSVLRPDSTWPDRYRMTGYWFLDEPAFTPPPELAAFLARGKPPVVITFGSMAFEDAHEMTRRVVEGVRTAGVRAILQAGWGGLGDQPLPEGVMQVDFVPHGWLFPRAACVVHHGGAGTTAAVLRAGVPSIIAWHLADQPAWGRCLQRLGVGPAAIPQHRLSATWLRRSLDTVRRDTRMRGRAGALGERIRQEDGVARAVELIQRLNLPPRQREL